MKIVSNLRIPYVEDTTFGLLFLSCFWIPLLVIPPLPDPLELVKFSLWSIFIGMAIISFTKDTKLQGSVLSKFFILASLVLLVWSVVSTVWSLDIINSLLGAGIRYTNSVTFFILWVSWLLLLSLQSRVKFLFLLKTLIFTGTLIALWGIIQSFGIGYYPGLTIEVRSLFPSFLGNPNYCAMFLVPVIFLIPWGFFQARSDLAKTYYVLCFAISIWGLIIFTSRGAILAFMLSLFLFICLNLLKKQWKIALIGFVIALTASSVSVGYLLAIRSAGTASVATADDQSSLERFAIWNEAMDLTLQNPLVGSGPSNFFLASRQYSNSVLHGPTWFDDAHNLFLNLAATMGIPALLAFLSIIVFAVWNYYKLFRSQETDFLLPTLLICGMLGWLIAAMFNPVVVPNWLVFGVMLVGVFQVYPQNTNLSIMKKHKLVISVVGGVLVVVGIGFLGSDLLLWQSAQLQNRSLRVSEELLNLSFKTNPTNITALFNLIAHYEDKGDYQTVERYIEYLDNLHPKSAGVKQKIFYAYFTMYNTTQNPLYKLKLNEAALAYEASNPYNIKTYQDLAYAFLSIGDLARAEHYGKKSVVLNGQDPYGWILLTKIYIEMNDYQKVIAAFEKSYQLRPNAEFRYFLDDAKFNKTQGKDVVLPMYFPPISL